MEIITSAILIFIATNMDNIVINLMLFFNYQSKKDALGIALGYLFGYLIVIGIGLSIGYGLGFIDSKWIGLLGFIPIYLGLRIWFKKSHDEEEHTATLEKVRHNPLVLLSVMLITFGASGDNIGIYVPYFANQSMSDNMWAVVILVGAATIVVVLTYLLSKIRILGKVFERIEHYLVPIIFVGLGLFILIENGTFVLPF